MSISACFWMCLDIKALCTSAAAWFFRVMLQGELVHGNYFCRVMLQRKLVQGNYLCRVMLQGELDSAR